MIPLGPVAVDRGQAPGRLAQGWRELPGWDPIVDIGGGGLRLAASCSRSLSGVLGFRLARDRMVRAILTALFALGLRGLPETRASIGSHKWWACLFEGVTANCITI